MEIDTKKLHLKFDGSEMESGKIDATDFTQTIIATTELIKFIGSEISITKNKEIEIDILALRRGSFEVDLAITIQDIEKFLPALAPLLSDVNVISSAKQIVDILKSLINVKKFLKGEKPSKVEIVQTGGHHNVAIHGSGGAVTVNVNTFNILQHEGTAKKLHKMVQPLLREGTKLESIEVSDSDVEQVETLAVKKSEALYFKENGELQTVEHKVRGIITAMDRKTSNGKISIGDKRVNFEVELKDISKLDKVVDGLIESMRTKVAIMVIGEAVFDYESNLKRIKINDIQKDEKLFI